MTAHLGMAFMYALGVTAFMSTIYTLISKSLDA